MKLIYFFCCFTFLFVFQTSAQKNSWNNLFDGKTLNGWKQMGGNAKYTIEKGAITGITVPSTPNSFLVTEKEYEDFVLELDVLIPDTTTNSGIQFRSHFNPDANNGQGRVYGFQYELDGSSRAWTGGIYDEGRRGWLYPLDLNPAAKKAYKPGVFNHVKIECRGNTIKTWVNGNPASYLVDTADTKGFIALQVHSIGKDETHAGKKIYWKNIRITENFQDSPFPPNVYVLNFTPNALTASEKQNGWKLLFNGINADGWKGAYKPGFPEKGWKIEHGIITVLSSQGQESNNGGDIVTLEQFSAFDISFDFKLTTGANSGVKYFVTLSENNTGSAIGLEYQVLDDKVHPDAKKGVDGNRTLASLYDLITARKPGNALHAIGEWNKGRIVVYPDNRVEHYLNGQKVLEYVRGSAAFRALVAVSKYQKWPNFGEAKQGHLLLQDHGDEVSFRSIKIKELK
ncbi:MAG: DUF1080 domain-containing protein [Chitinophagaceae bacterium]|nr:DUF1080 domain-containing protein [Chitinophagaceae bacterium]